MKIGMKSLGNESGKTAVIIVIVLAVIAYLAYPGTSPFKADYYNLKAEGNLKDLHRACNRHWANGMAQRMVSKATGIQRVAGPCELDLMMKEYDFKKLEGMKIEIVNGTKTGFQATGKHAEGDKILKVNAHGKIKS
jgi:Tfp pilus assembly protein PilE